MRTPQKLSYSEDSHDFVTSSTLKGFPLGVKAGAHFSIAVTANDAIIFSPQKLRVSAFRAHAQHKNLLYYPVSPLPVLLTGASIGPLNQYQPFFYEQLQGTTTGDILGNVLEELLNEKDINIDHIAAVLSHRFSQKQLGYLAVCADQAQEPKNKSSKEPEIKPSLKWASTLDVEWDPFTNNPSQTLELRFHNIVPLRIHLFAEVLGRIWEDT